MQGLQDAVLKLTDTVLQLKDAVERLAVRLAMLYGPYIYLRNL